MRALSFRAMERKRHRRMIRIERGVVPLFLLAIAGAIGGGGQRGAADGSASDGSTRAAPPSTASAASTRASDVAQPTGWDAGLAIAPARDLNPDPHVLEVEIEAKPVELEILPGKKT